MDRRFTLMMAATVLTGAILAGGAAIATPMLAASTTSGEPGTSVVQADKYTQLTMDISNNTGQTLTLVEADHNGSGDHWQKRAPQTLTTSGDGSTAEVTVYGSGSTGGELTYALPNGQYIYFDAWVSGLGVADNSTDGSGSNDSAYVVDASLTGGWNVTATFNATPAS